jgi:hypothetical protein
MRGQTMTMIELSERFDALLKVNGYPIFQRYRAYLKDRAEKHAKVEYALWSRGLTTKRPSPKLSPLGR